MQEVRAEIAAKVWQVRVAPGQSVEAEDTIMVLESMKMEIPVVSPIRGRVSSVAVSPDAQVNEGDLLAVIEPVADQ
jgi:acetyl-CoA carboxylase biotin carboxyl carrier protein